ncbi:MULTISPECIES: DNA methyltransferase [Acetobacteraceae]|uniref:Methyltransferase n=1 Tax=Acetobacter persici TaxID=1076596 RepID=A0A1U9LBU0_9PROT|nr:MULTISPECIES: DNA methyltransferase [Acetobacteraceae]AQT03828.1 DNA methylase [Acetobacter persici]
MTLLCGDCRLLMPDHGPFDLIIADPPYGETSLAWDRHVRGWLPLAAKALKPHGSLWVFGSLRSFMATAPDFRAACLRQAQEIVWEKQNGSVFHADRFRRVHELLVQFYPEASPWRDIYNVVATTDDARGRVVRRKMRPTHTGAIGAASYRSVDGGPRLAGRRYVGCEIDAEMAQRALDRLASLLPFPAGERA